MKTTLSPERKQPEVADIFRLYGADYRQSKSLSYGQIKVMRHIKECRTAFLGGHVERCNVCSFERIAYNSCRNRHCPKCQAMAKEQWLNDRKAELLPCGYFHLVFTLPHDLNPFILGNRKQTLTLLFSAANETLQTFARDPQWRLEGQLGFIAVLHTWSQTLIDHFHLHCLIPGGALVFTKDKWIPASESFLFRVESLAKEFRKRYLRKLKNAYHQDKIKVSGNNAFGDMLRSLAECQWIVYAKRPFSGPQQVLEYLGRYTHRVAISNHRILSSPYIVYCTRQGCFYLSGPGKKDCQGNDSGCGRVYKTLSAAYPAKGLYEDPLLRVPGPQEQKADYPASKKTD
jgi:hypothetical protein